MHGREYFNAAEPSYGGPDFSRRGIGIDFGGKFMYGLGFRSFYLSLESGIGSFVIDNAISGNVAF